MFTKKTVDQLTPVSSNADAHVCIGPSGTCDIVEDKFDPFKGRPSTCPVHSVAVPESDDEGVPMTIFTKKPVDQSTPVSSNADAHVCIGPSGTYDIVEDKFDPFKGRPSTCPVHSVAVPESDDEGVPMTMFTKKPVDQSIPVSSNA